MVDDEHGDDNGIIVILPSIAKNGMSVFEVNVEKLNDFKKEKLDKANDDVLNPFQLF